MSEDSRYTIAQYLPSRQYVYWMVISVSAFVVAAGAVQAFQFPPLWSFVAGIAFSEALNPVVKWFHDWRRAEVTAHGS